MENLTYQGGLSPWFLALPWICRQFGALIVAVIMITLWTLLLFFNVSWWIIFLTIIIPAIPLTFWLWYWTHQPENIPSAAPAAESSAAVKICV
jgi:hypothetical protein